MWAPYRGLIHHSYSRIKSAADKRVPEEEIVRQAKRSSTKLLSESVAADLIDESYEWEDPREGDVLSREKTKFSKRLINFLHRKDHRSRRALESLLLGYYSAGYSMLEAVRASAKDYDSLGEWALPLESRDILLFSQFFWDWRLTGINTSEQQDYARRILSDEDRSAYFGVLTIEDIRINEGVAPIQDLPQLTFRIASLMGVASERELKRIIKEGDIMRNPNAYGALAGFVGAMQAIAKSALEMGDAGESTESLQTFMDDKYDEVDEDVVDWTQQEGERFVQYEDLVKDNEVGKLLAETGLIKTIDNNSDDASA